MQHDPRNDNHVVSWNNLLSSADASNDGNDSSSSCGAFNSSANTTPSEVCDTIDKQLETHHSQPFIQAPPPSLALPSPHVEYADMEHTLTAIHALRYLETDAQIDAQVHALCPEERRSMLDAILRGHSHALFLGLCTKDRGVVIGQLLSWLTPSPSSKHQKHHHQQQAHQYADVYFQATIQLLENHWTELCSGQYGSIAVCRLFAALPSVPYKQYVAQVALKDWVALSQHRYGNFAMRDILQVAGQHVAEFDFVFARLSAGLALPLTFCRLAECKFAGHVVETVMNHAPTRYIQQISAPLFTTDPGIDICVRLGNHKQGNYPLQAVIKAVSNCDCDPSESLVPVLCNVIWPRLERSPYRLNLFKAARPGTLGAFFFNGGTSLGAPHGSTSVHPQPQYQTGTLNPAAQTGTLNPAAQTGTLNPAAQSFRPASQQQQQDAEALSGTLSSCPATVKVQSSESKTESSMTESSKTESSSKTHYAVVHFKHDSAIFIAPFRVQTGDLVMVESTRGVHGVDIGQVAEITTEQPKYPVPLKIVRRPTQKDIWELHMEAFQQKQRKGPQRASHPVTHVGCFGGVETTSVYPQPQYQTGTLNPTAQSFQPASQQRQDTEALAGSSPSCPVAVKIHSSESKTHYAVVYFKHVRLLHDSDVGARFSTFIAPFRLQKGDHVIVEGNRGGDIGQVQEIRLGQVTEITTVQPSIPVHLKIVRCATQNDHEAFRQKQRFDYKQGQARRLLLERTAPTK